MMCIVKRRCMRGWNFTLGNRGRFSRDSVPYNDVGSAWSLASYRQCSCGDGSNPVSDA